MWGNEHVSKNTRILEPTLSKKYNDVAYHKYREVLACAIYRIAWEPTGTNLSDLLNKQKTSTERD